MLGLFSTAHFLSGTLLAMCDGVSSACDVVRLPSPAVLVLVIGTFGEKTGIRVFFPVWSTGRWWEGSEGVVSTSGLEFIEFWAEFNVEGVDFVEVTELEFTEVTGLEFIEVTGLEFTEVTDLTEFSTELDVTGLEFTDLEVEVHKFIEFIE